MGGLAGLLSDVAGMAVKAAPKAAKAGEVMSIPADIAAQFVKAGDPAAVRGAEIMDMLRSGRGADVTDEMLDMGDPVANVRLNQYLYQNYDLPMDQASRMERAGSGGFDVPAYRGTMSDEYSARKPKVFVSQNPDVVQSFAGHISFADEIGLPPELAQAEGGNIIPLLVNPSENSSIVKGYELQLPANQIRSRFARFDPRLAHLRDLSAAAAGTGLLGTALQDRNTERGF